MKVSGIDIESSVEKIKQQIEADKTLSASMRATFDLLLLIVNLLCQRLGLNSRNSSKPPSSDQNREKQTINNSSNKSGGQKGHKGSTLALDTHPDITHKLPVDHTLLPQGFYKEVGYETRQVVDIEFKKVVTEYQAQILENEFGKRFIASFPDGVNSRIQYGNGLKAHAVYLSQYQLLPYDRIREYFTDQLNIPLSSGSLYNFINSAYSKLEELNVLDIIKANLQKEKVLHADETGININGKRQWLHNASSLKWTYLAAHEKRGHDAMDYIGILPHFNGVMCHDHWKPYYRYDCRHSLCNAHHLRELIRANEQDGQVWAETMRLFLVNLNQSVLDEDGVISKEEQADYINQYRAILKEGEKESPPPIPVKGKRGRPKKTKSRNLLERLQNYEGDVLRFVIDKDVPFTNNQGENDLRMAKVQQKISGCFRSEYGAEMFFGLRSYLSSCKKQGVSGSTALALLLNDMLPNIFTPAE
ncbi:IS66 family transposase [Psychromonas antarctica]|uniref:IS66 family transposase n=1 Tax=Psychromonas antarctica TaxID=67573 RepID=UPI001EE8A673|nr:IS66 family transposase [Psychromonas antarctica]MCG6202944.1 IS66 family transposase [Psychromonas antarctica]